ncbi:MAG: alpha/beta fold hydrolase [Prochloraceae cyanobacterium]|nr:alpha/beta fold hydrolase [Prochloraceae cyanobacterium]
MKVYAFQDQYIKVDSINTRYWTAGNKGKTIILLHSAGGSIEFWLYNIGCLAKFHRVYAIDMVGSGRSDKPSASYSLLYLAQFIKSFMDTLGIKSATLIGHSLGGGVALKFALISPEQLEKLVLVGSFGLGREIAMSVRFSSLPFVINSISFTKDILKLMLKQSCYEVQSIQEEWIELRYPVFSLPNRHKALVKLAQRNLNLLGVRSTVFRPILENLKKIKVPSLIIWGKQDSILPVAHAYVAAQNLPNNCLNIFDFCGHIPQLEYPEKFNCLVLDFISS